MKDGGQGAPCLQRAQLVGLLEVLTVTRPRKETPHAKAAPEGSSQAKLGDASPGSLREATEWSTGESAVGRAWSSRLTRGPSAFCGGPVLPQP